MGAASDISLPELFKLFPDNDAAEKWFRRQRWPDCIRCAYCNSRRSTSLSTHPSMPYRCRRCKRHFSVKTGSVMQGSKLGYQTWAIAVYLVITNLKGVSSTHVARALGITQKTAWHLMHRIREAWVDDKFTFYGPVEVDETYIGGKQRNRHWRDRRSGRGVAGKHAVVGMKDRWSGKVSAKAVGTTDAATLHKFVASRTDPIAWVFSDEHSGYIGIPRRHATVRHSANEYVRGNTHTNGVESFWSMLKRGYKGTYHSMNRKHLNRYVAEFVGRHNQRRSRTMERMSEIAQRMPGKRLTYRDLTI